MGANRPGPPIFVPERGPVDSAGSHFNPFVEVCHAHPTCRVFFRALPAFTLRIQAHELLKQAVIVELEEKLKAIEVATFIGQLVSHQQLK